MPINSIRYILPILGILLVLAVIAPLYYLYPPNPDTAVFDYIGGVVSQGGKLYQDVADQNWPGQMLIHVASAKLFGSDLTAYRTFELIFILPLSCLIIGLSLFKIYNRTAALISIPVYVAMYATAGYWSAGQREIVAAPMLVGAITLLYMRIRGSGQLTLVGQGVLISLCMLIRPTLLIILPLLTAADILLMRRTNRSLRKIFVDHTLITFTIIASLSLCALLAHLFGVLDDWLKISILFNLKVYGGGKEVADILAVVASYAIDSWNWYIVWSIIGAVFLVRKNLVAATLIASLIPTTFISVIAQGKGFIYHLAVIYPLFAILISIAIAEGVTYIKGKDRSYQMRLAAAILVCLPALGLSKKVWSTFSLQRSVILGKISPLNMYDQYTAGELVTIGDVVRASEYINLQKSEDTKILFWGRPCHVYSLTGLKSPLFAASFALLDEPTEQFELFEDWYQKVEETFRYDPPQFLILVKNPDKGEYEYIHPGEQSRRISDVVKDSLHKYRTAQTFSNLQILALTE